MKHGCIVNVQCTLPYDNNDSIKDIIRVFDVSEEAKGHQLEDHLKDKHAGEDNIANLQNICQFVRLWDQNRRCNLLLKCKTVFHTDSKYKIKPLLYGKKLYH